MQDKKTDPTGTWKWSVEPGDQKRVVTLVLKLDGGKLTGTYGSGTTEAKIEDGKIEGDEVSFAVSRVRGDRTFTTQYKGKVSGDAITGSAEFEREGKPEKAEWVAKRERM